MCEQYQEGEDGRCLQLIVFAANEGADPGAAPVFSAFTRPVDLATEELIFYLSHNRAINQCW
jgi:hypothetical protein